MAPALISSCGLPQDFRGSGGGLCDFLVFSSFSHTSSVSTFTPHINSQFASLFPASTTYFTSASNWVIFFFSQFWLLCCLFVCSWSCNLLFFFLFFLKLFIYIYIFYFLVLKMSNKTNSTDDLIRYVRGWVMIVLL